MPRRGRARSSAPSPWPGGNLDLTKCQHRRHHQHRDQHRRRDAFFARPRPHATYRQQRTIRLQREQHRRQRFTASNGASVHFVDSASAGSASVTPTARPWSSPVRPDSGQRDHRKERRLGDFADTASRFRHPDRRQRRATFQHRHGRLVLTSPPTRTEPSDSRARAPPMAPRYTNNGGVTFFMRPARAAARPSSPTMAARRSLDNSSAETATITTRNGGLTSFEGASTAGQARPHHQCRRHRGHQQPRLRGHRNDGRVDRRRRAITFSATSGSPSAATVSRPR